MTNAAIALTFWLSFSAVEREAVKVALGSVESGNDDKAIGKRSERSRFQIMPSVWRANCPYRLSEAKNPVRAWICATNILDTRVVSFHRITGRRPDWRSLYALWNAPGIFYRPDRQCYDYGRLPVSVKERAGRFEALVEDHIKSQKK
jgi:hypothetical protein